jgi:hypothetical protein
MLSPDLKEKLSYRHMVALSAMLNDWVVAGEGDPDQQMDFLCWSEGLIKMAREVGPFWDPEVPEGAEPSIFRFLADKTLERYEEAG